MSALDVKDLTVRFGGNVAVNELSLEAPLRRLTGLIGPNGAGKTTTFAAISGLLKPSGGSVHLFDRDASGLSPAARAQLGLGRTFQRTELCSSLTVLENVALGPEARAAGRNPWRQLVPRRADRAKLEEAVTRAVDECRIGAIAHRLVGSLSVGQRRLVELARVHAGDYRLLLLDEPSSGLDPAETTAFGTVIRGMVDNGGLGILLVEHDMALVMDVCDYLYTLDFGQRIFAGTPAETRASDTVRAAYLGGDIDVTEVAVMLALEHISAGYGQATVLRDVSVVVPDGAVVAMLGSNGAGKTTLLRVASGLLRPSSGRLLVDGVDATGSAPHDLRALGICHVPEGRGVFPALTVRENLRLFCLPGKEELGLERAVDAFPTLGQRLSQTAGTMSGGEQQMLALARAHASEARVVLLDEVSMGLAPKLVDEIFEFLDRLAAEGTSLLLVEQYVAKALAIARYVCMLDRGRLVFVGEAAELNRDRIAAKYLGENLVAH